MVSIFVFVLDISTFYRNARQTRGNCANKATFDRISDFFLLYAQIVAYIYYQFTHWGVIGYGAFSVSASKEIRAGAQNQATEIREYRLEQTYYRLSD